MAVELNLNDEKDKNTLSGPAPSASGPAAAPGQARPQGATPSGRPNVQQYLKANQGAGEQLQSGIQSNFNKQIEQSSRDLAAQREALNTKANPLEKDLGDEGSEKIKSSFKDPAKLLNQQGQLDLNNQAAQQWQRYQTGGYQGDIQNLNTQMTDAQRNLQAQTAGLSQTAQGAGTETGRFDLLRNSFGQPNYSRGQQKLDQLFLQAQPGVARNLQQNLTQATNPLKQNVEQFGTDAGARMTALQNMSKARQDQIKGLLSSGVDSAGLETDLTGRGFQDISQSAQSSLANAQAAVANVPGLRERLAKNQLTSADLSALGLQSGTQLYDTDLSQYITQNDRTPTLANAADPAEFARYRALQQLAGDTSGDIYGGATEVGGFTPYDFNRDSLTQGIEQRRNYWETERPRALADAFTSKFVPASSGGGMRAARSPMADYGYNVLRPALQQAQTVEQMDAALNAYNQVLGGYGLSMDTLNTPDPALTALRSHLAEVKNKRQRSVGTAPEDLEGLTPTSLSNTFGVV
jgi:hypothetical protein